MGDVEGSSVCICKGQTRSVCLYVWQGYTDSSQQLLPLCLASRGAGILCLYLKRIDAKLMSPCLARTCRQLLFLCLASRRRGILCLYFKQTRLDINIFGKCVDLNPLACLWNQRR